MKSIFLILSFTLFCTSLQAQNTVFEALVSSEDHTIFTELLQQTGLDILLNEPIYHSVFAPNDETFNSIFSPAQLDSIKLDEQGGLENLLLHHIIPDTVNVDFGESFLPLHGNYIVIFIDGSGNVLVTGGDSTNPTPRLVYGANNEDNILDVSNGKILWMERNLLTPKCEELMNFYNFNLGNVMYNAIPDVGLDDTIMVSEGPLTIIVPEDMETIPYIEENGGFEMTPFLDSFVRRHIVEGYFPLQQYQNDTSGENWLGETVLFTKNGDGYFVNNARVRNFADYKNAVILYVEDYVLENEILAVNETAQTQLKIYPNPASSYFEIQKPDMNQKCFVFIYNHLGDLVFDTEVVDLVYTVDVSEFRSGLYFLSCNIGNKTVFARLAVSK